MTDGRWSVGIMCTPKGDEDVILYDGQVVPAWDVVTILNSRAETDSAPGEKVEIAKIIAVVLACSKAAEHSARALEAVTGYLQAIDERMEAFQRDSWERAKRGLDDERKGVES